MMQPPGSRPGISSLASAPASPPMTIQPRIPYDSISASPFPSAQASARYTAVWANAPLQSKCRRWSKISGGGRKRRVSCGH